MELPQPYSNMVLLARLIELRKSMAAQLYQGRNGWVCEMGEVIGFILFDRIFGCFVPFQPGVLRVENVVRIGIGRIVDPQRLLKCRCDRRILRYHL